MQRAGVYIGLVTGSSKPQGVPAPADSSLTYTVQAFIDGSRFSLSGVAPPVWSRPDPARVDVEPVPIGSTVLLVGVWSHGRFDGFMMVPGAERMAFADCEGG